MFACGTSVQNRCTKDYRRDFRAKGGIRVFVFQTTLLQNSRVWILPGWFCNLAFGELQIESRQMTTTSDLPGPWLII